MNIWPIKVPLVFTRGGRGGDGQTYWAPHLPGQISVRDAGTQHDAAALAARGPNLKCGDELAVDISDGNLYTLSHFTKMLKL